MLFNMLLEFLLRSVQAAAFERTVVERILVLLILLFLHSHLIPLASILLDVLLQRRALCKMEATSVALYWKQGRFFCSEFDIQCWMTEHVIQDQLQFSKKVAFWFWTVVF